MKDEIKSKNEQIDLLEKRISSHSFASDKTDQSGVSHVCSLDITVALFICLHSKLILVVLYSRLLLS